MKKFIPLILLIVGALVFAGVYFFVIKKDSNDSMDEERALLEVELEDRPVVSLIPTEDGHWLNLKVEKLTIEAASVEYELLYDVADGRVGSVFGTVELNGQTDIERELLLGSESSGKFRFDEGVDEGTLTLTFRNDAGKLLTKFSSDFKLSQGNDPTEIDNGVFEYTPDSESEGYYIVMETIGYPSNLGKTVVLGPFGVFTSRESLLGEVNAKGADIYIHTNDSEWKEYVSGDGLENASGIFIGSK